MADLQVLDALLRGAAAGAQLVLGLGLARRAQKDLRTATLLFIGANLAFLLGESADVRALLGPAAPALWSVQIGSVGFFWLFTRALFEDRRLEIQDFAPAAGLIALGLVARAAVPGLRPWLWMAHNAIGLALAVHAATIVLRSGRWDLVEARRRARVPFLVAIAGYSALLSVAQIGAIAGVSPAWYPLADAVLQALLGVTGATLLLEARGVVFGRAAAPAGVTTAVDPDSPWLDRLADLMRTEEPWRREGLSVAELAGRLGLPEHRLRRLINQRLGHRNFPSFVNQHRIAAAKAALSDPASANRTIASLAVRGNADHRWGPAGPLHPVRPGRGRRSCHRARSLGVRCGAGHAGEAGERLQLSRPGALDRRRGAGFALRRAGVHGHQRPAPDRARCAHRPPLPRVRRGRPGPGDRRARGSQPGRGADRCRSGRGRRRRGRGLQRRRQSEGRRGERDRPRLRRTQRGPSLDVRSDPRRARADGRRQRLEFDIGRSGARHGLPAHLQRQPRLLRRPADGRREPDRRHRRAASEHGRAPLVLPDGAPRSVGLRHPRRARAVRSAAGRPGDPGPGLRDQAGVRLRARSPDRQAALSGGGARGSRSDVPGERSAPTQPFSSLPAIAPQSFDPAHAFGLVGLDAADCRRRFAGVRNEGLFTPPSLKGAVLAPTTGGGANWGGVAIDPVANRLVVNSISAVEIIRLIPRRLYRSGPAAPEGGAPQTGAPYGVTRGAVLSSLGIPCNPPPWGLLTAIDLDTGKLAWRRTLGTTASVAPLGLALPLGTPNIGGPLITGGGLVFIAATMEERLRAFDLRSGREQWSARLPASAQASPMTYSAGGRQYVVIAAGGHSVVDTKRGDDVVAFRLPP